MSKMCEYCHSACIIGERCTTSGCPNEASEQDERHQEARDHHEEMMSEFQHEQFLMAEAGY